MPLISFSNFVTLKSYYGLISLFTANSKQDPSHKIIKSFNRYYATDIMRNSMYKINPLILNRWSPRSMTGEELTDEEIMSLFEAARWAPSSSNAQPWRFIYAKRNTEQWDKLFDLMFEGNKIWTKNAAVLVVVISRRNYEQTEKPSKTYQFDAGAAWENLALEAATRNLAAHGMAGFDYEKARKDLDIPDNFDVMAMIAIGKRGSKESLQVQLQERETTSDRKPLEEIVMEGIYKPVSK